MLDCVYFSFTTNVKAIAIFLTASGAIHRQTFSLLAGMVLSYTTRVISS